MRGDSFEDTRVRCNGNKRQKLDVSAKGKERRPAFVALRVVRNIQSLTFATVTTDPCTLFGSSRPRKMTVKSISLEEVR